MEEDGKFINLVSYSTIVFLVFLLATLLILLIFLYKYLNKEANGKYTVNRIVFREGGLRDRARDATVAMGSRLGIQLWHRIDTDQDQENDKDEEEEQVNSDGDKRSDEDDAEQVEKEKSDNAAELNNVKGNSEEHNAEDGSDEEEQQSLLVEPEPELKAEAYKTEESAADEAQEEKGEPSGAIVINLNQFSGSVLWSEEDADKGVGDVTAL